MEFSWYIKRLRAMSAGEVVWRFSQKRLSAYERKAFSSRVAVYALNEFGVAPRANLSRLGINFANPTYTYGSEIELLGGFPYAKYKKRWHAAFQSPVDWPFRFSADYSFGADGVPGDIRTNWELNRHFQFVELAKSFYVTGEGAFLAELSDLFGDWNGQNPFMWGPEWSSPMEESIRLINWLVTAAFLGASEDSAADGLCEVLCAGAWCMAAHVRQHYSRYSSANNHTIVEAAGVAVASIVFNQTQWLDEALELLRFEVELQTYADGVNKEQSLHYELFVMEALCLVSHVLNAAGKNLPKSLKDQLCAMARYVRACCVGVGSYIEFGDDDEGVILNLGPHKPCYPEYVLAFATLEVGDGLRWVEDVDCCETLEWLYSQNCFEVALQMPLITNSSVESFRDGGITIVRFDEGRAVLAFDHGPLGFGQLAAHGHADALSIQLYVDGEPVLIDPGTYIYNGDRGMRDRFRSTRAHNTVCVGDRDQSEALGPFLWGRKANVLEFKLEEREGCLFMSAEHDGYGSVIVSRTVKVDGSAVAICDSVSGDTCGSAVMHLHFPLASVEVNSESTEFYLKSGGIVRFEVRGSSKSEAFDYSPAYGLLVEGTDITAPFREALCTVITICQGK